MQIAQGKQFPCPVSVNQPRIREGIKFFVGSFSIFKISKQGDMQELLQAAQSLEGRLGQAVIYSNLLLTGLSKALKMRPEFLRNRNAKNC